jgi:hypothetical protein
MDPHQLTGIIVRAKAASYVGGAQKAPSSRPGSHDISWAEGDWRYLDSYFGGTDFLGQEVLWFRHEPVWAMNYYGYIIDPTAIDATRAGATIRAALSALYTEGRFLGEFEWQGPHGLYRDSNVGGVMQFRGREDILVANKTVYALDYFGGMIKP